MNQQVARRFLERLGCEVTVVDNGERAVAACAELQFDLVLMDVQMPVMDGLAATRAIRSRESDGRRTPIIALTASAMTDELERCMASGMDAVLTKPLELPRLRDILDSHGLERASAGPAEAEVAGVQPVSAPLDLAQLGSMAAGDAQFVRQLCDTFVASGGEIIAGLERALTADDRAGLAAMAHKLKGASASIYAHGLASLAAELEANARDHAPERLGEAVGAIRSSFGQIAGYVAAELK